MQQMSTFQLGVIGFFVLMLIIGTLIFAGIIPGFRAPQGGVGGTVVWWGTLPSSKVSDLLEDISRDHKDDFTLEYVEKNPLTIENDLLEALALGKGPDLVTLSSDMLVRQTPKLQAIPYATLPKQTFKDTYVLGTHIRDWELLFGPDGVMGLPIYVDPLVLYYNQDLLANAKLVTAPRLWNNLATILPLLVKSDGAGNLTQAGIALGTFNNNNHAKDDLALLLMQAGNSIVGRVEGVPTVSLKETLGFNKPPAGEATAFFLRFADPANTLYAWNSSQTEARDAFLRGKLAMYLGFGSERSRLTAQNPQLNFDLAPVPQREEGNRELTLGRFNFLSIPRAAQNAATAYQVATLLSGPEFAARLAAAAEAAPARNDLLSTVPADPQEAVIYQAAVIARDWLDPAREASATLLRQMVESISLGRSDPTRAINDTDIQLSQLIPKS
jgi:multiple sugar transport system substrate-binding protein